MERTFLSLSFAAQAKSLCLPLLYLVLFFYFRLCVCAQAECNLTATCNHPWHGAKFACEAFPMYENMYLQREQNKETYLCRTTKTQKHTCSLVYGWLIVLLIRCFGYFLVSNKRQEKKPLIFMRTCVFVVFLDGWFLLIRKRLVWICAEIIECLLRLLRRILRDVELNGKT